VVEASGATATNKRDETSPPASPNYDNSERKFLLGD
jgi:hypothetical protein